MYFSAKSKSYLFYTFVFEEPLLRSTHSRCGCRRIPSFLRRRLTPASRLIIIIAFANLSDHRLINFAIYVSVVLCFVVSGSSWSSLTVTRLSLFLNLVQVLLLEFGFKQPWPYLLTLVAFRRHRPAPRTGLPNFGPDFQCPLSATPVPDVSLPIVWTSCPKSRCFVR